MAPAPQRVLRIKAFIQHAVSLIFLNVWQSKGTPPGPPPQEIRPFEGKLMVNSQ